MILIKHRHHNKYLNNSVNEPNLVDLERPSGTLNSVAETTSTVFCAVWMYTVRMDRTWCCNTLKHRRFCRCTGPVGPPWFPVLPESKTPDFASPQKCTQLAPQSAIGLVPVGPTSTLQHSGHCALHRVQKGAFSPLSHRALSARLGHCFVGLKLARSHREQRSKRRVTSAGTADTSVDSNTLWANWFPADVRRAHTTADSE